MKAARKLRRLQVFAAAILASASGVFADAPQGTKPGKAKPLAPEIIRAWRDAGAIEDQSGGVPAFQFQYGEEGALAKLTDPGTPFSLHLVGVNDAGMKELAGMKSLQSLNVNNTRVTAGGIAALQKELPACQIQK